MKLHICAVIFPANPALTFGPTWGPIPIPSPIPIPTPTPIPIFGSDSEPVLELDPEMAAVSDCLCWQTTGESFLSFISSGETSDLFNNNNIFPSLRHVSFSFCSPAQFQWRLLQHFFHSVGLFFSIFSPFFFSWATIVLGYDKTMDGWMDSVSHVGATPTAKWSTQFGCGIVGWLPQCTLTMDVVHAYAQILAIGPLIGKTSAGAPSLTARISIRHLTATLLQLETTGQGSI